MCIHVKMELCLSLASDLGGSCTLVSKGCLFISMNLTALIALLLACLPGFVALGFVRTRFCFSERSSCHTSKSTPDIQIYFISKLHLTYLFFLTSMFPTVML